MSYVNVFHFLYTFFFSFLKLHTEKKLTWGCKGLEVSGMSWKKMTWTGRVKSLKSRQVSKIAIKCAFLRSRSIATLRFWCDFIAISLRFITIHCDSSWFHCDFLIHRDFSNFWISNSNSKFEFWHNEFVKAMCQNSKNVWSLLKTLTFFIIFIFNICQMDQ